MCFVLLVAFLGPRAGTFVYWIGWPARFDMAFDARDRSVDLAR